MKSLVTIRSALLVAGMSLALAACAASPPAAPPSVPAHDNLNATLWMQRSVEYRASAAAAYALARQRLEQALSDRTWTAAPGEQVGNYQNLPPAIVIDLDETALDNSAYQAWMVLNNQTFNPKTWTQFVNAEISTPVEGAVDFLTYAEARGVKVFYVSNRTVEEEPATRRNMQRYSFPMDSSMDTVLTSREKPDWTSAKSTRRAYIAKDYRILLNLGDNFGDFSDAYRGSEAERQKVYEDNRQRWGREWIMLPNPTYGSFESAPFGHNYKLSPDEQRAAKRNALRAWNGQ